MLHKTSAMTWLHFTNWSLMTGLVETWSSVRQSCELGTVTC